MLLQKRKNIQGDSPFLKTAHIPFDKLTDLFMLSKTVYHRTSLVGFGDKVAYNMSVSVQTKKTNRDYYMQQIAKWKKQTKRKSEKEKTNVYQIIF